MASSSCCLLAVLLVARSNLSSACNQKAAGNQHTKDGVCDIAG
jgi:hypothetical protein